MLDNPQYRAFVQSVIDNIKKNGFPDKKVAFPIERMYELAQKKGFNFNKVLATLDEIQIAHEKTPEKIIFFPRPKDAPVVAAPQAEDLPADSPGDRSPFAGIDPSVFSGLDPSMFSGFDMSALGNMDPAGMMDMASKLMGAMNPEQLASIRGMYENMSDEARAQMMEQMRKLGLVK